MIYDFQEAQQSNHTSSTFLYSSLELTILNITLHNRPTFIVKTIAYCCIHMTWIHVVANHVYVTNEDSLLMINLRLLLIKVY